MAERADNYAKLGGLVFFGEYPTYLEKNEDRIKELNDLAGKLPTSASPNKWTSYKYYKDGKPADYMWYIDVQPEEDGKRYRGVYFTEYRPLRTDPYNDFDVPVQKQNGYLTNVVYWFTVEDIWWKVIMEDEKTALVISNDIIDAQPFYAPKEKGNREIKGVEICQNNYVHSDVRKWLNGFFLDDAFTGAQKKRIPKETVDNAAPDNRFACENTKDQVFLLSRDEAEGLMKDDSSREMGATDYAKCQGVYVGPKNNPLLADHGDWWLRTPDDIASNCVCCVDQTGKSSYLNQYVNHTTTGVVPAMFINL